MQVYLTVLKMQNLEGESILTENQPNINKMWCVVDNQNYVSHNVQKDF